MALSMKKKETPYLATDISPSMIEFAKKNIQKHFELYESKLRYEEWLQKVNLSFRVVDGEEPIEAENKEKFDRIIINLGLNLTQDPVRMLQNFYNTSTDDCEVAITIPGFIEDNRLMDEIHQAFTESGYY